MAVVISWIGELVVGRQGCLRHAGDKGCWACGVICEGMTADRSLGLAGLTLPANLTSDTRCFANCDNLQRGGDGMEGEEKGLHAKMPWSLTARWVFPRAPENRLALKQRCSEKPSE
jgi:hypothetical protein